MSILGFDAIGRMALGQISQPTTVATFTPTPSTRWFDPVRKGLSVAVIATTFVGFVPPPQAKATPAFTKFAEPVRKTNPALQAAWKFSPVALRSQTAIFTQFSQPQIPRINLPDEQPSALFEILPPQAPSFTGFARFSEYLPKKSVVFLYSAFQPEPGFVPVVDTHDGVWVKKKRKKPDRDPLDLELEERAKRRAAIELAVYGPEVTYEPPAPSLFAPAVQPPPNVEDLARAIMAAKKMHEQQQRAELDQDDEDVLEMILRDL